MLSCSQDAKFWIRHSLICLPGEVSDRIGERLAFVCMDSSDGRRLTREFCENHEIIILSERIVPRGCLAEDNWNVRYFMFAVLHEVAHAFYDDQAPNSISDEVNMEQEHQADAFAFTWLNKHLKTKNQPLFTNDELAKSKIASQDAWVRAFGR